MARYQNHKNLSGRHTELTEHADVVANALSKVGARVSPGVIERHGQIRIQGAHVKMRKDPSCLFVKVLSKAGNQHLHVYGIESQKAQEVLGSLKGFTLKVE